MIIQYIALNIEMSMLCFVVLWLSDQFLVDSPLLYIYSEPGPLSIKRKISWRIGATSLNVIMFALLLNLTGVSVALLLMYLSNVRAIEKV